MRGCRFRCRPRCRRRAETGSRSPTTEVFTGSGRGFRSPAKKKKSRARPGSSWKSTSKLVFVAGLDFEGLGLAVDGHGDVLGGGGGRLDVVLHLTVVHILDLAVIDVRYLNLRSDPAGELVLDLCGCGCGRSLRRLGEDGRDVQNSARGGCRRGGPDLGQIDSWQVCSS